MMYPPLVALLLLCGANIAAAQLSEDTDAAALRDFAETVRTPACVCDEGLGFHPERESWEDGDRTCGGDLSWVCERLAGLMAAGASRADAIATAGELSFFKWKCCDTLAVDQTVTWTAGTSPCGDGWNSYDTGWLGVQCTAESENQGRVDSVRLQGQTGVRVRGDLAHLANLTQLRFLDLQGQSGVRGDLAHLANLTQLGTLNLIDTNAHGNIAALIGLTMLRQLFLCRTLVYGDATAIRDSPDMLLQGSWAAGYTYNRNNCAYTACSDFASCPAGASPSVGGDDAVGADACACCDGSSMVRESTTGACVCTTDAACGLDFVCSSGSCVVPGALFLRARCFRAATPPSAPPLLLLLMSVSLSHHGCHLRLLVHVHLHLHLRPLALALALALVLVLVLGHLLVLLLVLLLLFFFDEIFAFVLSSFFLYLFCTCTCMLLASF